VLIVDCFIQSYIALRSNIFFAAPVESLRIVEDIDRVGRTPTCDGAGDRSSLGGATRHPGELPLYQETKEPEHADNLNEVSNVYIHFTSLVTGNIKFKKESLK